MDSKYLSSEEAKKALLEELTEEEFDILFLWIRTEYGRGAACLVNPFEKSSRESFSEDRIGIKVKKLYQYTWHIISGDFDRRGPTINIYQKVYDFLDELRTKLHASKYANEVPIERVIERKKELKHSDHIATLFEPTTVWNKHTRDVHLTTHAFVRFYERYYRHNSEGKPTYEDIVCKLGELFRNAIPIDLPQRIRVKRILNNNFKQSDYFLHPETKLRFVVFKRKVRGELVMSTIEQPD